MVVLSQLEIVPDFYWVMVGESYLTFPFFLMLQERGKQMVSFKGVLIGQKKRGKMSDFPF